MVLKILKSFNILVSIILRYFYCILTTKNINMYLKLASVHMEQKNLFSHRKTLIMILSCVWYAVKCIHCKYKTDTFGKFIQS